MVDFPLVPLYSSPEKGTLKRKNSPEFYLHHQRKSPLQYATREIMHTAILDKITGTGVGWYETFTYIT